jgi:hypothetical protein
MLNTYYTHMGISTKKTCDSSCDLFMITYVIKITFGLNLEQSIYYATQIWLHLYI